MKKVFVAFLTLQVVLVLTIIAADPAGKGYNCEKAKSSLKPCIEYLTGKVDSPSAACCNGVKEVKSSAPTKDEKIAACQCIEEAGTHIPNLKQDRAIALPKQCGVDVGFPSPRTSTVAAYLEKSQRIRGNSPIKGMDACKLLSCKKNKIVC